MNNKIMKFGYEDTDKKIGIEIYGLVFEINNLDKKNIEDLRNLDRNENVIENEIDNILGFGAVEKLNNKRKKDGYDKMTLDVELAILGCIFETYAKATTNNMIDRVTGTVKDINKSVNDLNVNNQNREFRRYNNRYNNRRNRRY